MYYLIFLNHRFWRTIFFRQMDLWFTKNLKNPVWNVWNSFEMLSITILVQIWKIILVCFDILSHFSFKWYFCFNLNKDTQMLTCSEWKYSPRHFCYSTPLLFAELIIPTKTCQWWFAVGAFFVVISMWAYA